LGNSSQLKKRKEWKAQGLAQERKSEGLAAGLNILPGIGDFYNGNVGLGVVNLLTWPVPILWAPTGGATGAQEVNYYETKATISKLEKNKEATMNSLLHAFSGQQITKEQFVFLSNKIKTQPLTDFKSPKEFHELLSAHEIVRTPANTK